MQRIYLTIGLPGSGKTTYIREGLAKNGVQVVSPDGIRAALGHRYYGPLEPQVFAYAMFQARALLHQGYDVVLDEATVSAHHVERWRRLADSAGCELVLLHFTTPEDVCLERRLPDGEVFRDVIRRKAEMLKEHFPAIRAQADIIQTIFDFEGAACA